MQRKNRFAVGRIFSISAGISTLLLVALVALWVSRPGWSGWVWKYALAAPQAQPTSFSQTSSLLASGEKANLGLFEVRRQWWVNRDGTMQLSRVVVLPPWTLLLLCRAVPCSWWLGRRARNCDSFARGLVAAFGADTTSAKAMTAAQNAVRLKLSAVRLLHNQTLQWTGAASSVLVN